MVYKTLELTVISAKDLKDVNLFGKMDVYVVVYLSDEPKSKQKTPVHQDGGTNPSWNYTTRFTIDDGTATKPGKYLVFQLKHEHTFGADKELGEVHVPLSELLGSLKNKDPGAPQFVTYQVKRSSGKPKGELKFSVKFIDMGQNMGYDTGSSYKPAQSSGSTSGYPSSAPHAPAGGSYPYPPPAGYPPSQQGGYPPQGGYPNQAPPTGVPYGAPQGGYPNQDPPTGVPYGAPYGAYPPHPPAGYGYPPQGGYRPQGEYPSYPAVGYGGAQKPQKPKKNNGFGMGMGAGLLGGAVGGLVLGEVFDDAFDGGGFDDGGFDF